MKLAALFSGGKDSTLALFKAFQAGHEIVSLLTMNPQNLDSFMFHSLNIELAELQAIAMQVPLIIAETKGEKEKELSDLKQVLFELRKQEKIQGVVAGSIASNYQHSRIKKICKELKLKVFAPLWQEDQQKLLEELLHEKFQVMITGVYAAGLNEQWIGRELTAESIEELMALSKKFGFLPVGEGGEFESLVIDCPLFKKKIKILEAEKFWNGIRGELRIKKAELAAKT